MYVLLLDNLTAVSNAICIRTHSLWWLRSDMAELRLLCFSPSNQFLPCIPAYLLISPFHSNIIWNFFCVYSPAEVATLSATFIKARALSSGYQSSD